MPVVRAIASGVKEGTLSTTARDRRKCFNCGKVRHLLAKCWEKGGGIEGKGPKLKKDSDDDAGNTGDSASTGGRSKEVVFATIDLKNFPRVERARSATDRLHRSLR